MRVEAAWDEFMLAKEAEGKAFRTIAWYAEGREAWRSYTEEARVPRDLSRITTAHVRGYILWLQQRGLAPTTVSRRFRAVRTFFRWCAREGLLKEDPTARVPSPKVPSPLIDTLTEEEMAAILKAARKTRKRLRDTAIVLLMYDSGLRLSEVVGLTMEDVDLRTGTVNVRLSKMGKGRAVPIGAHTARALQAYITRERKPAPGVEALFLGARGEPITPNAIRLLMKRLQASAGVNKRIHAHLLRHSFATSFLRNGGNVFALQKILGHATLTMSRYYAHLSDADAQRVHQLASPGDMLVRRKRGS